MVAGVLWSTVHASRPRDGAGGGCQALSGSALPDVGTRTPRSLARRKRLIRIAVNPFGMEQWSGGAGVDAAPAGAAHLTYAELPIPHRPCLFCPGGRRDLPDVSVQRAAYSVFQVSGCACATLAVPQRLSRPESRPRPIASTVSSTSYPSANTEQHVTKYQARGLIRAGRHKVMRPKPCSAFLAIAYTKNRIQVTGRRPNVTARNQNFGGARGLRWQFSI